MDTTDPRLVPARGDIASSALKGKVDADMFVDASRHVVITPLAPLRTSPQEKGGLLTQLLYGEAFEEFERKNGWSWGQASFDGYVGYVRVDSLGPPRLTPNFRICVPASYVYETPDLKSPVCNWLSMAAVVRADKNSVSADFIMLEDLGWVFYDHLQLLDQKTDPVETAMAFVNSPYLWGGRSSRGLDCSALVQIAAQMAGRSIPRDTDLQEQVVGISLAGGSTTAPENIRRGDLVFFPGHMGIMEDKSQIIHANAFHMKTVSEPLEAVIERLRGQYQKPITSVRRPDF